MKATALPGNQTINERYDAASSFGIYKEKPITHALLIRRVADAFRNLLLLYIAYHVELFNTLNIACIFTRFIPTESQSPTSSASKQTPHPQPQIN